MIRTLARGFAYLPLAALSLADVSAQELAPIEAYGALPETSLVTLTPSGSTAAMRMTDPERDLIVVFDLKSGQFVTGARADEVNPRTLKIPNENTVLLVSGRTYRGWGVRSSYDFSSAHSFNFENEKVRQLLVRAKNLYPHQSGLGRVIAKSGDGGKIYMLAFVDAHQTSQPTLGIYEVRLDRARDKMIEKGDSHTIDWFMNDSGQALIREDYNEAKNQHRIWRVDGKKKRLLYEDETAIRAINLVGISLDRSSLVIITYSAASDVAQYYLMSLEDGLISGPILGRDDADIEEVFTDMNRVVLGVRYSGFRPTYHFFDEALSQRIKNIQSRLPETSAHLQSWSEDFETLVFYVSGVWSSGMYLLFEEDDSAPRAIGTARPAISDEQIAETRIEEYEAGDGLKIPALVTATKSVFESGDDTVVPIEQSRRMEKALKKAGKEVTYVALKGEDHWLTQAETRLETLRLMAEFIDKHL